MTKHFLVSLILVAGCLDTVDDDSPVTDPIAKISTNSLLPTDIVVTSLGLATLTPDAITAAGLTANQQTIDYLQYVLYCSLPATTTITIAGTAYRGQLGLAPSWLTGPLSDSDRHLVTGCVLARSNATGTTVSISLDSANSAILGSGDAGYGVDEGAFFGDILGGGTGSMGACIGVDQAHDPLQSTLPQRKCAANQSYCNFTSYGLCSTACTTATYPYAGCGGTAEVVSVKLAGTPD
jgi:hypothetical protein